MSYRSRRGVSRSRRRPSKYRIARSVRSRVRTYTAPVARAVRAPCSSVSFGTTCSGRNVSVSNREFVCDVMTVANSSAFAVPFTAKISATNSAIFPWLSGIASHFEFYRFDSLNFIYEPACTSQTTGQLLITADFDPNDESPSSWASGSSFKGAKHGSVWAPLTVSLEKKDLHTRAKYYTKQTGVDYTMYDDLREMNVGTFSCCIENVTNAGANFASATSIGKLYVSYSVQLIEPEYGNDLIAAASGTGAKWSANPADLVSLAGGGAGTTASFSYLSVRNGYAPFSVTSAGLLKSEAPFEGIIQTYCEGGPTADFVYTPSGGSAYTLINFGHTASKGFASAYLRMPVNTFFQLTFPTNTSLTALSVIFTPCKYTLV